MGPPTSEPIGLELSRTAKRLSRAFDDALAAEGASLPVWLVLVSVKAQRHAMQRDLAEALGIEGATLTHHLNRMEDAGLVTRRRDPANRRIQIVELTDEGDATFARLVKTVRDFDRRLRRGLSDDEVTTLRATLEHLRRNTGCVVTAARGGGFRLRRRPHQVVLITHVLSSVGWFGVAVLVAFCGIASAVTGDPTLAHSLRQVMETAPFLTITLGLGSAATGTLLGLGTRYGLIRYWWVVIKIAVSVAVIVTDAVLIPRVAHLAAATGVASSPLYGASIAHVVLLGAATTLSFVKPKVRTPWSPEPKPAVPRSARIPVTQGARL